jgi:predicted aldo/keto reductase-like oxidoreductase
MPPHPNRRHFLKTASAAAVLPPSLRAAAPSYDKGAGISLPTRTLGKTGAKLPILGYGGAALPRAWGSPLSTDDRIELVRHAFKRGIRYFDTAGNYMESTPILGRALEPTRKDAFLVGKVETTDPAKVRAQVEKALGQLRTDYLDAILIHGTPGLEQMTVKQAMEVHAELLKLKDEEIARHIGFSAHSYFGKALALINSGGFDLCMLSLGYISRGSNQVHSPRMIALRDQCVARAHEKKMGIVAMKVVAAGLLGAWSRRVVKQFPENRHKRLPGAAIRHALADKRIHHFCIGMRLQSEIEANLATFTGDTACTEADRQLLADYRKLVMQSESVKKLRVE